MLLFKKIIFVFLVIIIIPGQTNIHAEDMISSAKNIKNKFENSVVILKITVKHKMTVPGKEMNETETQSEIIGTIIDPSGLIVISLTATEPSPLYRFAQAASTQMLQPKWESEISNIKIRVNDSLEVPGKIVLHDKNLDLAFIQPLEKYSELPCVNIKDTAQVQILDQIVILGRLGKFASWASSIALNQIEVITPGPNTIYISESSTRNKIGSPAFSIDGKFIGIFVLRNTQAETLEMNPTPGSGMAGSMPVILPVPVISEAAKQLLQVPAPEK